MTSRTGVRTGNIIPIQPEKPTDKIYINNIYIRAREEITKCYTANLGYWPTPSIMDELLSMVEAGADVSLLCAVLEYTAQTAPRPTWAYARVVLRKQLAAGVRDADGFNAACNAFRAARAAALPAYKGGYYRPAVQEQKYQQRHYDDSYNDIPADQLAAMEATR